MDHIVHRCEKQNGASGLFGTAGNVNSYMEPTWSQLSRIGKNLLLGVCDGRQVRFLLVLSSGLSLFPST